MSTLAPLTDDAFEAAVLEAPGTVLVDFWATWCGPCKRLAPLLAELAEERAGQAAFYAVDIEEAPRAAERFQVTSVPTVLIVKDGEVVHRMSGAKPRAALRAELEPHLS